MIVLIVLETIAANLGSMFTPIGNPQNLYLFSISNMSLSEFLATMLPLTLVSYLLLHIVIRIYENKNDKIETRPAVIKMEDKRRLLFYSLLFLLCIGTVLHFMHYFVLLGIILLGIIISDKELVKKADYSLLLTFVAFFIFIGNMQQIEVIQNFLRNVMKQHTMLFAVISSQVISNVPSAVLLSGFTNQYVELLKGVNIGGLGTLIASMASLISYRYYANTKEAKTGSYIGKFTVFNILFLVILLGTEIVI
jgi:Na+/H+ antiporter NhaD/arsenite permease-like protein